MDDTEMIKEKINVIKDSVFGNDVGGIISNMLWDKCCECNTYTDIIDITHLYNDESICGVCVYNVENGKKPIH